MVGVPQRKLERPACLGLTKCSREFCTSWSSSGVTRTRCPRVTSCSCEPPEKLTYSETRPAYSPLAGPSIKPSSTNSGYGQCCVWAALLEPGTREKLGATKLVGEWAEQNRRGWKALAHENEAGQRVVTLPHPSIAAWNVTETDPSDFVRTIIDRAS